jgi:hypothetical protein
VIQEGGYALDQLAACSEAFATGLLAGSGVPFTAHDHIKRTGTVAR